MFSYLKVNFGSVLISKTFALYNLPKKNQNLPNFEVKFLLKHQINLTTKFYDEWLIRFPDFGPSIRNLHFFNPISYLNVSEKGQFTTHNVSSSCMLETLWNLKANKSISEN